MGKYAVIIGCNYPGTSSRLRGCWNDTKLVHKIIKDKGFPDENIKILRDDDVQTKPTFTNVSRALRWLAHGRTSQDSLFMSFSGHGSQIPSDGDDEESDNKDEVIVLSDFYLLADDDLKTYFVKIPVGCKLTVVLDSCHSGSMLDHKTVPIKGVKQGTRGFGGTRNLPVEAQKARFLPASALAMMYALNLNKMVLVPELRSAMKELFGNSSKLVQGVPTLAERHSENPDGTANSNTSNGTRNRPILPGRPPMTFGGRDFSMDADLGILITGCQESEYSYDCYYSSEGNYYGALTKTLHDVYFANRNATHHDLVRDIRSSISTRQNPCLECSLANASTPFVC